MTHVGEWLGSLMVQLECTLEQRGSATQTYIDDAGSTNSLPLHIREGEADSPRHILCVDQADEMRRHELRKVQHSQDGELV